MGGRKSVCHNPGGSVFEGKVKDSVFSEQGKEAVVALHGNGDFIGEGCLSGEPLRLATVSAMTDSAVTRLDGFYHPRAPGRTEILRDVYDIFAGKECPPRRRLGGSAFQFQRKAPDAGQPQPIIANISQETLAEMVGTTRSRVSTFMNKFRRLGFIHYNGTLEVHNSLLNVVLHDNPHL